MTLSSAKDLQGCPTSLQSNLGQTFTDQTNQPYDNFAAGLYANYSAFNEAALLGIRPNATVMIWKNNAKPQADQAVVHIKSLSVKSWTKVNTFGSII